MNNNREYCVAIRTLGKAGEKYQKELDSLMNQTIKPKHIFVYIAEGYEQPKETVGFEEYIWCKKGMVAQRALPFNEVDTKWCLFLDDDVYLPPTSVERMFDSADRLNADCVAADTFKNQNMTMSSKVRAFVSNWVTSRKDDEWAFKIGRTGEFSYNANPTNNAYLSQSAAGPCSLWKIDALRQIHFEHEIWLDKMGFAYGDDLLYFHKLYRNGGALAVDYKCGVEHLDAQSERNKYNENKKKLLFRAQSWFVIWWRIKFEADDLSNFDKLLNVLAYSLKFVWNIVIHILFSIRTLSLKPVCYYISGNISGYKFVHSEEYQKIPNFIVK